MLNELKISAILLLFINVMLASDNEMTNSFASISECDDSAESIYYNTLNIIIIFSKIIMRLKRWNR